ncbi:MAG: radical SAM family heme chaperone HemW [Treponema sp.]|nr:radical SAM family heme chaperone HemW [Treponema sp.]
MDKRVENPFKNYDLSGKNISLYIHIPFCLSKCSYCDFFSQECKGFSQNILEDYLGALKNQIEFVQKTCSIKFWNTIYIGGGTPSLLSTQQINNLFESIKYCSEDKSLWASEITLEVNPDDLSQTYLEELNKSPVTRLSCGLQSLNQKSLEFVGRRADREKNLKAMDLISRFWKKEFSYDLICGLPHESKESFFQGLEKIISFNPNHISMYSLTLEEQTPLGKYFISHDYDYDFADNLWLEAKDFLEEKGYFQYEISNFCKRGCQSKHNLVYWNHKDYIGCGPSAAGSLYNKKGEGIRLTNKNNIKNYIEFWKSADSLCSQAFDIEIIDLETSLYEFFMMGLRKVSGITAHEFSDIFNYKLPDSFIDLISSWEKKNLAIIQKEKDDIRYKLSKTGLLYLNKFLENLEIDCNKLTPLN